MASLPVSVLGFALLLALVAGTEPIARRVGLPLSIVLVIVGTALGFAMKGEHLALNASLTISSDAFLYLFLPILLFETAIDIDVRRLLADIGPILLLAVAAVLACILLGIYDLLAPLWSR